MVDGIIDSSILIDLLRKNTNALAWHTTVTNLRLNITPIVWMELVQGPTNKQDRQKVLRFLKQFPVEFETRSDTQWAMRQVARFSLGYGMHLSDILIASVAVRLTVPVYTLNTKHFAPLPSLRAIRPY